jgi:hypothetical protein
VKDGEEFKDLPGSAELHNATPHHHQQNHQEEDDLSYEGDLKLTKFIMKNGCCRECMKAFSKNGKSCLCQVPRL